MSEFGAQVLALLRKAPGIAERTLMGESNLPSWVRAEPSTLTPDFLEELKRVGAVDEITRLKLAALSQARPAMREIAMRKLLGQASSEGLLPSELFHGTGTDAIKGIASSGAMTPQVSWQEGNKHLSSQTPKTYWATDPEVAIGMALESAKTGSMREELRHQVLSATKHGGPAKQLKFATENVKAFWLQDDKELVKMGAKPEMRLAVRQVRDASTKWAQKWGLESDHPLVLTAAFEEAQQRMRVLKERVGRNLSKTRRVPAVKAMESAQRRLKVAEGALHDELHGLGLGAKDEGFDEHKIKELWAVTKNPVDAVVKNKAEPALIRARLKALLPHMDQESKNQLREMLRERLSAKHDALTKSHISHEHVGPLPYKNIYELRAKGEIPAKMLKAEAFKGGEWVAPKSRKQVDALMTLAKKLLKKGR